MEVCWGEYAVRASVANEIITLPILQASKERELTLDPFMGSGTAGRVCDGLNKCFVGHDLKMI